MIVAENLFFGIYEIKEILLMKKLLSLLLAICMMTGFVALLPSFAAEESSADFEDGTWTAISTVEQFETMASDGKYYLTKDLDFGNTVYEGAILKTENFAGIFDGCGYSLLNIVLTPDGNGTGIFNKNFHGILRNLKIGTENAPVSITTNANASIGTVTKSIEYGECVVFENVTVYTNMVCTSGFTSDARFAAFAGYCDKSPTEFINCHVYGSISGQPAAGFVVTNGNESVNLTFRDCSNNATITCPTVRSQAVAGFFAESWSGSGAKATLNFYNCENNGAITSGDYSSGDRNSAGGFVCWRTNFNADVYMEGCTNSGKITAADGCGAGFIAVRKDGLVENALSTYTLKGCVNTGDVTYLDQPKNTSSAGIVAIPTTTAATVYIENCANLGNITGGSKGAGGIMNTWNADSNTDDKKAKIDITIIGSFNAGAVTAVVTAANSCPGGLVGGIAGTIGWVALASTFDISYCYNTGSVTVDGRQAAGIVAELDRMWTKGDRGSRIITNCYNIGTISGSEMIALARADLNFGKAFTIAKNSFYTGDLKAINSCIGESGNAKVTDAAEMLAKLTEVQIAESSVQFVEDVYGINGGFPVLSWQVVDSTSNSDFSAGSIEGEGNAYTVSTDGISGFVSARVGETTSDLRFVLAVDLEAAKNYDDINVTVEFCNEVGVVKSFTIDFEELEFYLTATGAGNTYTAAEGDALFGLVVTGVPNTAWNYAVLTVNIADGDTMSGVATSAILG